MTYELFIEADTNDGDYTTRIVKATEEDIEQVKRIVEVIKNHKISRKIGDNTYLTGHNWENGDQGDPLTEYKGLLSEEDIEWFDEEIAPHGEYGIHTIENISYYPLPEKITIL